MDSLPPRRSFRRSRGTRLLADDIAKFFTDLR